MREDEAGDGSRYNPLSTIHEGSNENEEMSDPDIDQELWTMLMHEQQDISIYIAGTDAIGRVNHTTPMLIV